MTRTRKMVVLFICIVLILGAFVNTLGMQFAYTFDIEDSCRQAGFSSVHSPQTEFFYPVLVTCDPGNVNIFPFWANMMLPLSFIASIAIIFYQKVQYGKRKNRP